MNNRVLFASIAGVGVLTIVIVSAFFLFSGKPSNTSSQGTSGDSGGSYAPVEPGTHASFAKVFETAVAQSEAWVKSADEVATRFATHASGDCGTPQVTSKESESVVLLSVDNCMDDSIQAVRYRVELARSADAWKVEKAGWQHKCRRGEPPAPGSEWHTELCP